MADTSLSNTNQDIYKPSNHYTSVGCHFIREFPESEIPWKSRGVEYQYGIFGLNKEIRDFVAYIKPTPEEQWVRELVIARYQSVIYQLWHYCKIDVCGSFRTGLYLPTSDIDLVIFGTWPMTPLDSLKEHLENSKLTSHIKVLSKATVPILKLCDKETGLQIDISFNMSNSIKAVNLIKEYLRVYPCLHHLVLVLKQFLFQRELNEVWTGGLGSYALIIICVSFLQHNTSPGSTIDDVNLGTLLVEFLELYGRRFNYQTTAISVRNGGSYEQKQRLFKFSTVFCIEDPLDCTNDIGRRSYAINEVKQAFEYAFVVLSASVLPHYRFLHSPLCSSIIGKIIRMSPEVVDHRERICEFARKTFVNLSIQYPTLSALHPSLLQQIQNNGLDHKKVNPQVIVSSSNMILASVYFGSSKSESISKEGDEEKREEDQNRLENQQVDQDTNDIGINSSDCDDDGDAVSTTSSDAPSSSDSCPENHQPAPTSGQFNQQSSNLDRNSQFSKQSTITPSKQNYCTTLVNRYSNSISSKNSNTSVNAANTSKRSRRTQVHYIRRNQYHNNDQGNHHFDENTLSSLNKQTPNDAHKNVKNNDNNKKNNQGTNDESASSSNHDDYRVIVINNTNPSLRTDDSPSNRTNQNFISSYKSFTQNNYVRSNKRKRMNNASKRF